MRHQASVALIAMGGTHLHGRRRKPPMPVNGGWYRYPAASLFQHCQALALALTCSTVPLVAPHSIPIAVYRKVLAIVAANVFFDTTQGILNGGGLG